jgi:maltose O-acetyltransferase
MLNAFKINCYKIAGIKIGTNCTLFGPFIIRPIGCAKNIIIGNNTFVNTEIRFGCPKAIITIGDNVQIGPRVSFETSSHSTIYLENKGRGGNTLPITIGNKVWIGAGCTILQGVTIGEGAVVAAGAIVNKNIPPFELHGGIPSRKLKNLR